jgi:hypothetical protein
MVLRSCLRSLLRMRFFADFVFAKGAVLRYNLPLCCSLKAS